MKRKRQPTPDTRLNWRDPNMPVYRQRRSTGETVMVQPATSVKVSQYGLEHAGEPTWRNDPTYNLKRRPK